MPQPPALQPLSISPVERSSFPLPFALVDRYRVLRDLCAQGAEADLLLVESLTEPGQRAVIRLYHPGIQPKSEVLRWIGNEAPQHVVQLLEYGCSDGIGYEVLYHLPIDFVI